ncbi:MAG: STAS domain-containing protein [Synechococcales bacterium]|nr:STAS domain-containing protein [Synechococcales bacterium]
MVHNAQNSPKVKVFRLTRILTAVNAIALRDWAKDCIADNVDILLIDFQDVSLMDSSGLGALVAIHRLAKETASRLVLCSLRGQARMLLEMTHMGEFFETYPDKAAFEATLKLGHLDQIRATETFMDERETASVP